MARAILQFMGLPLLSAVGLREPSGGFVCGIGASCMPAALAAWVVG